MKEIDSSYKWECSASPYSTSSTRYQEVLLLIIVVVGTMLLLAGTMVFAHLLFKHTQVSHRYFIQTNFYLYGVLRA